MIIAKIIALVKRKYKRIERMNGMFKTMQKFSERTGLSYSAIRKLALTNQLSHVKVGNRYMIHIEKGLSVLADLATRMGHESDERVVQGFHCYKRQGTRGKIQGIEQLQMLCRRSYRLLLPCRY